MKADGQRNRISILPGNLIGSIHQFASDSFSPVLFQHTKVDNLRPSFPVKGTALPDPVDMDISGRMPLVYRHQGYAPSLCLVLQSCQVFGNIRMPALGNFLLRKNPGIRFFHIADHQFIIIVINHSSSNVVVFALGGTLGVLDMLCFGLCKEQYSGAPRKLHFGAVLKNIRKSRPFCRLVIMWTAWCFTSNLAGPYLGRYSINDMGLSFMQMTVFGTTASAIATILVMSRWGRAMNHYGCRSVMLVSAFATALMDAFYLFSAPGSIWPVLLRNFFGAACWSGCNLAANSMQLSSSPDEARPSYIAVFACITCLVGVALGTLCGGVLLESWEGTGLFAGRPDRLQVLVILSVFLRLLVALLLVPPLENDRDGTPRQLLSGILGMLHPARFRKAASR